MLIFDLGVAAMYLEVAEGLGIPPPEMLTDAVLILFLVLFGGGLMVELLFDYDMVFTMEVS